MTVCVLLGLLFSQFADISYAIRETHPLGCTADYFGCQLFIFLGRSLFDRLDKGESFKVVYFVDLV